ncbi:MAG: putative anti-sigmaE protein [Cyanobacteria bacterium RYN_339]|nr:putative anti-sigmaE protein [Cyanobacteria bacterium RYN_339]
MSSTVVMSCEEFQDLAALLALDVLEADQRPQVAGHVATCPACSGVMADLVVATGALAYAAPARSPRADLKDRLMAGLETREQAETQQPVRKAEILPLPRLVFVAQKQMVWTAAAVVLATGLLLTSTGLYREHQELGMYRIQQAALADQIGSMMNEEQAARRDAEMLAGTDVRMVAMQTQPMAKSAEAWVYWSPTRHAWLATFKGLPDAGPNKTYQLWAVTPGKKVSMGTFVTDKQGVARVRGSLPQDGKPVAAAVTLEPAGGMPGPTGPMVMVGPIKAL